MTANEQIADFLLDNLTTAVMLFDEKMQLSFINTAAEDLLSISSRKVLGHEPDQFLPNTALFTEAIERSFKTRYLYVEWAMEIDLPSQKTIVVDCVFSPIQCHTGGDCLIVELVDTHSHRRFEREENLMSQHITAKESARSLAHEIKNPLGGIRGAAQLLQQELPGAELREYTDIVIREADRLRNLVDRMLTSDRELKFVQVNIHEILEYVCNLIAAEADFSFQLQRDYDPSLPEIQGDRESLIQVFLNVIRNALQAIEPEGRIIVKTRVERKITIAQVLNKLCLRIDIVDNGPGIPDEIVDSVFYPMITSRAEGTGLGLSIAQSLIQHHGGFIEYKRSNKQTDFTILLPLESNHD